MKRHIQLRTIFLGAASAAAFAATATAQANAGTTQIDTGNFRDRYRFFQIRPLPQAPEAD